MSSVKDPDISVTKGSTVTRVLDILEAVAASDRPLTPTDLSDQLAIPKASVHRLCASMEEQGFLQSRINGRGLQVGTRLHAMSLGVLASAPIQAQRRAILKTLSEEIGETCNISIPDGSEMIYFDRAETHWPVRVNLQVGSRVPACATAGGKMYLSSLDDVRRERVIKNTRLSRHTANTLVSQTALLEELKLTAQRGYATDNEEYIDGMVAMAVPVRDSTGRLYATLSFHAPCMRVPFAAVTDFLEPIQAAAKELTAVLDEQ